MKTRKKKSHCYGCLTAALFFVVAAALLAEAVYFGRAASVSGSLSSSAASSAPKTDGAQRLVAEFAREHGRQTEEWPDELIELLDRNPDTEEYVLQYPLKKGSHAAVSLDEYKNCRSVPLLFQWDERWGYTEYGDGMMGLTGCGPTCLSMVCIYLLGDTDYNPRYIADFSEENGYCLPGNGSSWSLISQGGKQLGLEVTESPLDKNRILRNLEAGNPIICVVGPGDFTTTGHFLVMTDCVNGKIKVNDPNSKTRSETLWDYDAIKDQIRNLWVCRR